jgi:Domain of unknown function (DUF1905)
MKIEYFTLQKFDSGMHYFLVDEKSIHKFISKEKTRCICTLNNMISFHCALMKKKEGGYYIHIGSKTVKSLKIKLGNLVTASFSEDNTENKFELCEELNEVLNTDLKAKNIYDKLTEGNKRSLIYIVSLVKSSNKKIERALMIAEKLKAGITSAKEILKK